uniref:Uncharacterized protein n=1 Tax=Plectus sambesii TaxID=2011161 RepID=A0A914W1M4_9BILA
MIAEVIRVAVSLILTTVIGLVYYNRDINPLAKMWYKCPENVKHSDGMMRELTGTWVAHTILTIFMMHVTEGRAFPLMDMVYLAAKMTFVAETLQFVHMIWKQHDLRELVVKTGYDFLTLFAITFAVTFNRHGGLL